MDTYQKTFLIIDEANQVVYQTQQYMRSVNYCQDKHNGRKLRVYRRHLRDYELGCYAPYYKLSEIYVAGKYTAVKLY